MQEPRYRVVAVDSDGDRRTISRFEPEATARAFAASYERLAPPGTQCVIDPDPIPDQSPPVAP